MPHSPQRRGRKNDTLEKRNEGIPPPAEERSLRKEAGIRSLSRVFRRKRATPPGIRANDIDAFCPTKRAVTTRNRPAACRVSFRTCAVLRRPHALPPSVTTRSGPDEPFRRTAHTLLPIVPTSVAQAATFPAAGSITTVPYVRTASHRIRSPANDGKIPKMPKVSRFRKHLPCKTGAKTSTGSSRLSATGSPLSSRPSTYSPP